MEIQLYLNPQYTSSHTLKSRLQGVTALLRYRGYLLCLITFGSFAIFTSGMLASAHFNSGGDEAAFSLKADKALKMLLRAARKDRGLATSGTLTAKSSNVQRLSGIMDVEQNANGSVQANVVVTLAELGDAELLDAGFKVGAHIGNQATVVVDVDRLPDLASLASVRKIAASVYRYPTNDTARLAITVDYSATERAVSQKGRGVVVGIVDSGIDFRHADFTQPGSGGKKTRIKALLDMTVYGSGIQDPGWNYVLPGQSSAIGHLYTESDINSALETLKPSDQNADPIKQRDKNGHGTHVAGTAAGNGLSSPTPGTYAGMAPEADLIVVKASRQNDGSASFLTADIINALQFVQRKAAELNEPFVVNLSFAGHFGPHDGSASDERAIDNLVNGGAGRVVCVAAGDDGNDNIHARTKVPAGGSVDLDFSVTNNPQFLELYEGRFDRSTVTVVRPDGSTLGPVAYDPDGFNQPDGQASDPFIEVFNANDDKGDADPSNDQPNIFVAFKPGAPAGNWKLRLQDADSTANAAFDAWGAGNITFGNFIDNNSRLIASPGNARMAITVGAFVNRSPVLANGSVPSYSSPGPTGDGRLKPDVSAPGHYLYSARSTDINSQGVTFTDSLPPSDPTAATDYVHYGGLAGTSMATAVTSGAVALFLQSNPALSSIEIRGAFHARSARPDRTGWNSRSGFGRLNILSSIQLGGLATYNITGHIANGSQLNTKVTLRGSVLFGSSIDEDGFYTFERIPARGNYTVTPDRCCLNPYFYSPPNYIYENLNSDQVADFVETLEAYTVSGRITDPSGAPVPGIGVNLDLGFSRKTQTDSNGNYSFPGLAANTGYMVAPYSPKYMFSPYWIAFSTLTKNETANFVATPLYDVSGTVVDKNGVPIGGVFVLANGPMSRSNSTDNSGHYLLNQLPAGGPYAISFSKPGFIFNPDPMVINNLASDQSVNSTGIRVFSIVGRVVDDYGTAVNGLKVTLSGDKTAVGTTFGQGNYIFSNLPESGNYTLTPTRSFFKFSPDSQTFNGLSGDTNAANFVMSPLNSIDDPRTFVSQHYWDFLVREPDPGGLAYWTGQITQCGLNQACINSRRIDVSDAFFYELEYQQTASFVYRLYRSAFGNNQPFPNPDQMPGNLIEGKKLIAYQNFAQDREQVVGGADLAQSQLNFANLFVQRPDFIKKFPLTLTGPDFVDAVLAAILNDIGADLTSQREALIVLFNSGGRGMVMYRLADDNLQTNPINNRLFIDAEYNRAFVATQYYGYLRRDPDVAGFLFWLGQVNRAQIRDVPKQHAMVCSFITSAEYQRRFSSIVTHDNSECPQ
jgi:subtilisin family serine protease